MSYGALALDERTTEVAIDATWGATALILPEGMSYEEWEQLGSTLSTMERAVNWWVGDWLNYGEHAYGEKYTQAIEATGRRLQSLMNMASVAGRIPPSRRRASLSWTCHRTVAYLEPEAQDRLLEEAERKGWGSREVEQAVAAEKKAISTPAAAPEESTRAGRFSDSDAVWDAERRELEEMLFIGADPEEAEEIRADVVAAESEAEPEAESEEEDADADVVAELERAHAEIDQLRAQVQSLSADDTAAELRKQLEKYARLEGRLQQEIITSREAKKDAAYAKGVLKKVRSLLRVERDKEIVPALTALVQGGVR